MGPDLIFYLFPTLPNENSNTFGSHTQENLAYLVTVRQIINSNENPIVFIAIDAYCCQMSCGSGCGIPHTQSVLKQMFQ